MDGLYHEQLLEEAKHPQNSGLLETYDVTVTEKNASCGDDITVYIVWSADGTHIQELKWQGHGCIISQAAMSVLSQRILDDQLSLDTLKHTTVTDMEQWLGITDISPGRVKCLTLGLQALQRL